MTGNGWLQIAVFFLLVLACAKPLGLYIAAVMEGKRTWLSPILAPCERIIYRICGVAPDREQRWTSYAASLLAFSLMSGLLLYLLLSPALWAYMQVSLNEVWRKEADAALGEQPPAPVDQAPPA